MGLSSLNAALSGLRISQQQISMISNNVANVGTPGFSRKILPQMAQSINGQTVGVLAGKIIRQVDISLSRDLWTQVSEVGGLDVKQTYLDRVSQFHGPPDKELSVAAEMARLENAFGALADDPSNPLLLTSTLNRSLDAARKINDLSNYLTTLRNDAQNEIDGTVNRINDILEQLADLNGQIKNRTNLGQTTALLEDQRDAAIQELSGLIDISFFARGDGVLVIQTRQGTELVSDSATLLTFDPRPVSPTTYYPDSVAGVYVGDPENGSVAAVDITAASPGGKLGGLLELRDVTFPKQVAQLDEMAHKLALRLDAQGLRLFTDASGAVPPDTPPDPSAGPPAVSVAYVGFSAEIRVNQAIINDKTLLQQGTYGETIPSGSNEVIRRALEFGFGDVNYQQAIGSIDLRVSALAPPNNTLQAYLGLMSSNTVEGTRNLEDFLTIADLVAASNNTLADPTDQFQITFSEPRTGLGPTTITIDLSVADGFPGATAIDRLVAHINDEIANAPVDPALAAVASVGPDGELVLESRGTIEIDGTFGPTGMNTAGLELLGLAEGTYEPTDPYFDIRVGNGEPVRITIEPGDDETDLMAKLAAVTGLAVEDITLSADGFLRVRPGNDYDDPDFGGDIEIVGGPFETSGAGAGLGVIPDGLSIVSALFGSFTTPPLQDVSPIEDVEYQSETFLGSGVFVGFRQEFLGPDASITTEIDGARAILDFGQKMVNEHAQELINVQSRMADAESLRQVLQRQLADDSGVNLDEELGNLIVVQTAYAASARVINAVDNLFKELLNAVI